MVTSRSLDSSTTQNMATRTPRLGVQESESHSCSDFEQNAQQQRSQGRPFPALCAGRERPALFYPKGPLPIRKLKILDWKHFTPPYKGLYNVAPQKIYRGRQYQGAVPRNAEGICCLPEYLWAEEYAAARYHYNDRLYRARQEQGGGVAMVDDCESVREAEQTGTIRRSTVHLLMNFRIWLPKDYVEDPKQWNW
jgi:hypothetical protein